MASTLFMHYFKTDRKEHQKRYLARLPKALESIVAEAESSTAIVPEGWGILIHEGPNKLTFSVSLAIVVASAISAGLWSYGEWDIASFITAAASLPLAAAVLYMSMK